ncbi:MAG: carbohydrate ABC transporter permease, partial [Chloroflexi bacterium]|nr:carbohydrate ABC transporter permease [Chloroflexota bacterium]
VPPVLIFTPTFNNFSLLLKTTPFMRYLNNTMIIASATTLSSLFFGSLAAYSFARFRYPGSDLLPLFYLVLRMLPRFVLVIPYYLLLRTLGLLNTHVGLILAYTTFALPFVIWMMIGFFKEIPVELEEAGMVDGAGRLGVLVRIVLPLALPGLAATAIFAFLLGWNELLFSIVLAGRDTRTLAQMPLTFETDRGTDWGLVMAAGTLILLPVIVFALAVQRYILRGMTLGAVKG